jgi:hypothetical protein
MSERVSYCMYHWDGPGALQHHDHLLSIPKLKMLQWTPGDGHEPCWDRRWWPYFHKTFDAGKKVFIWCDTPEHLLDLKREFGQGFKQFLIGMGAESPARADEILKMACV